MPVSGGVGVEMISKQSAVCRHYAVRRTAGPILALLLVAIPANAAAGEEVRNGAAGWSLMQLEQEMRLHNPQLEQARENHAAAEAVVPQVTAPSNAQIGLIENPVPRSPLNLNQSQGFSYTLTQPFSFPGKKRLAGEIAQAAADFAGTQTDSLDVQLLAQLKASYYQLLMLQRQIQLNQDDLQRLEVIKAMAKIRYANNAAAYVDFLNAQVAASSARNARIALERQADTVRRTINTLIGRGPSSPLAVAGDLPAVSMPGNSLETLEQLALERQPVVKGAGLQTRAADTAVRLARKAYYPDFQVVLTAISDSPPLGVTRVGNYGVEFDMVLPTWFFTREKAGLDQARAALMASQANDRSVRQQTVLQVDAAYNALAQAVAQTDFLGNRQLPEAKAAYRLALTNYGTGNADFTSLMTAQMNLRDTELALLQNTGAALQAQAALAAAVGMDIR